MSRSARVVIASTRAAAGVYEDRCGPMIVDWLNGQGIATPAAVVVADGRGVVAALFAAVGENVDVIITSGGTGISPTDGNCRRNRGQSSTTRSPASPMRSGVPAFRMCRRRCCPAGYAVSGGRTLIVNLPGSTGGVKDGLGVLDDVLEHALDQLAGKDHTR